MIPAMTTRAKVAVELGTLTVLTVAFLLIFPHRHPLADFGLAAFALVGVGVSARYTKGTIWGSLTPQPAPDAGKRCWKLAMLLTAGVLTVFLLVGFWLGFGNDGWAGAGTRLLNPGILSALALYVPWALAQQTLFQFYLLGRLAALVPSRPGVAIVITGFGYSLVHLPDYGTTAATAVSGVVWSYLYFRYRRLLPLALSHALLGCAFYYWVCGQNLAPEWTLTTPGLPAK